MSTLSIGQPVPDFEAITTSGNPFKLSDFKNQNLVLFFYPKDNTPGCTQENQDFRDHYEQFATLNCRVFGISRDSLKSHENFKTKHSLPFELISDTEETLCQLFEVIKLKNLYGKQVLGIERSTFLINSEGILTHEWRKVKVKDHVKTVLQALA